MHLGQLFSPYDPQQRLEPRKTQSSATKGRLAIFIPKAPCTSSCPQSQGRGRMRQIAPPGPKPVPPSPRARREVCAYIRVHIYIYIYIYMCVYMYVYIWGLHRKKRTHFCKYVFVCQCGVARRTAQLQTQKLQLATHKAQAEATQSPRSSRSFNSRRSGDESTPASFKSFASFSSCTTFAAQTRRFLGVVGRAAPPAV